MEQVNEDAITLNRTQAKFLSEVQVLVGVEVGELSISAAELIDLLPGHVFEFRLGEQTRLSLRVGGEKIGEAELVEENGELALRIVSLGKE